MDDQIASVHSKYLALDPTEIIKSNDTTNLNAIQAEVRRIYNWEGDFYSSKDYRDQLPLPELDGIAREFENASNFFDQLVATRSTEPARFLEQRESYVSTVKNYYNSLYKHFVQDWRGWKTESAAAATELEGILAEARKLQKAIKKTGQEVEQSAEATTELTRDLGLTELAKFFNQLVVGDGEREDAKDYGKWRRALSVAKRYFEGYRGAARVWLLLAIAAFGFAFWVADSQLVPYVGELTTVHTSPNATNASASVIYAVLVAKSLVLLVPVYAIRFCLKNYGSNKHLAADALQKAKTLQTLPSFLEIPRGDESAVREVAVTVARLVFAPTVTGFIVQKGDYEGSDITINAPQLKPPAV